MTDNIEALRLKAGKLMSQIRAIETARAVPARVEDIGANAEQQSARCEGVLATTAAPVEELPFKLPTYHYCTEPPFIVRDANNGRICETQSRLFADAIVTALNAHASQESGGG